MGEKTEKASPKKLRDAKKKGQIAKSQDLPSAFTFIGSIWATLALAHFIYGELGAFIIGTFTRISQGNLTEAINSIMGRAIEVIFYTSIPVLAIVTIIGVLANFVANGPVFAPEVFKFDIQKFNPVTNLKQKFKMKTLVELVKSLAKIGVASWIIYDVMYNSLPVLVTAVSMPMASTLMIFQAFLIEVVIKIGLFYIIVAALDFAYQKKDFAKEMMMEKFEVKQEHKSTEGDPQIKGKRRQIAQEIAYQDGPLKGIKQAQAVVVNPTHLAVAIAYDKEIDAAPYIVAMAEDALAERLIGIAKTHDIPIVRNIKLAHNLWNNGDIYEYVPEDTYEAIAEILKWIAALHTEEAYNYEEETGK